MADVMETINKVKADATDVLDTVQDKVAELVDELSAKVKEVLGDLPELKVEIRSIDDLPNAREIATWGFETAEDLLGKQKEFTFKLIDAVQPEQKKAPAKKKTTAKKTTAKKSTAKAAA